MDSIYSPYKTYDDVIYLLKRQIEILGSQKTFAKTFGLSCAYVNDVVHGRKKPGPKILDALYLEAVTYYIRKCDV